MKALNLLLTGLAAVCLLSSCGGESDESGISGISELIPLYDGDTFVYIDTKGEVAIIPEVEVVETSLFREEYALVGIETDDGRRYGFLDTKGKLAIPAKYIRATTFSEGLAWVVEPDKAPAAIDRSGKEVFSMPDAKTVEFFSDGLAKFGQEDEKGNTLYGFVDKKGKVVIKPDYPIAQWFSNGLSNVSTDKQEVGYINKKGKMVIAEQFAEAIVFTPEGYASVKTSEGHGVIDKKGSYVINPQYAQYIKIDRGDFIVKEGGKIGIIDKDGKVIVPMDFKDIYPFQGRNYTSATMDGRTYGFIDREGKFIINPQFEYVVAFIGDVAVVAMADKVGIVNEKGEYIFNPIKVTAETLCFDLLGLSVNVTPHPYYSEVGTAK
ncbi:MAG: WG repeat-containing protein [Prevotella sp.]|jgi:hypothetical protein|nr:WG repeat-containing protein [Prevotella sp.]